MRERQGRTADRDGALHMIEAVIAALLMISCLACLSTLPQGFMRENNDDMRTMSADLLYMLEYRENLPEHPGLAQALSMPEAWEGQSMYLGSDLRMMVPAGYKCCMVTPYGETGDYPPEGAAMYVRPFLGLRRDTLETIDCKLILWRG